MAGPLSIQYLAGIIDGEGTVSMYKWKDGDRHCYGPRMSIASKDKWFLEEIQKTFGGSVGSPGKSGFGPTKIWQLRFSANEARNLLPDLIPHLILKRQEAILLLEGLAITKDHRGSNYDRSPLDLIVANLKILKKERVMA